MTYPEHHERLEFLREERAKIEQFLAGIEEVSSREDRELARIIGILKRVRKKKEE